MQHSPFSLQGRLHADCTTGEPQDDQLLRHGCGHPMADLTGISAKAGVDKFYSGN